MTPKILYKGTLGVVPYALLATPGGNGNMLKHITLCNSSAATINVFLRISGVNVLHTLAVGAKESQFIDTLMIPCLPADLITGHASAAGVDMILSGAEY